jgi:HEAT repeat protein
MLWLIMLLVMPAAGAGVPRGALAGEEQLLKDAKLPTEGPGLLDYLRQRTPTDRDREKIDGLIGQLSNPLAELSQAAGDKLVSLGPVAVPALRQAQATAQSHSLKRIEDCLGRIEKTTGSALTTAVIHLIAAKKPSGAAAVLLDYGSAGDETVREDVEAALAAVGVGDGVRDPLLLQALEDKFAGRRVLAAATLCRMEKVSPPAEVRRLLKDADLTVRLRVARLLVNRGDASGVPVLMELLTELPAAQAWQAEEALRGIAGAHAPSVALGADDKSRRRCREAWEAWWREHDGAALLALFRRWTPQDFDMDQVQMLVQQLGDDDFDVREKATTALIQKGGAALALLREAAKNEDLEVVERARFCLKEIEKGQATVVPASAARLLALRRPAGAAEALLAYLPIADESGAEEIREALAAVAVQDGKPDEALRRALTDKAGVRRAAAAEVLCRAGPGGVAEAKSLFRDSDPLVRLRVAAALADLHDRDAVPVLIDVLGELPENQAWRAEEILRFLAGSRAPSVPLGRDVTTRKACHDAWKNWWEVNGKDVDLACLDDRPRFLGYTVIAEWTEGRNGRVLELGSNARQRWEVDKLPWPLDAEVLPGNRLLLAEFYERRISERNFRGDVLWEKRVDQTPLAAKRLANGHTFIATSQQILEVDRSGKEVVNLPGLSLLAAKKLRDGRIACIVQPGRYMLLDSGGKELNSFPVGSFPNYGGFDILPGGGVLVPHSAANDVIEYDSRGQVVWRATVEKPSSAERLGNGHTLVASRDTQQVVEVDRSGKVVWQFKSTGYPWRGHRR